jgi:hypothetical protein
MLGGTLAVTDATSVAFTVNGAEVFWHPFASVIVTVYVPFGVGVSTCDVAPEIGAPFRFHWYDDALELTNESFVCEIVGTAGVGKTVTVAPADVPVQPDAFETFTVYAPPAPTRSAWLVAPETSAPSFCHW